jgi:hypothetical protein
LNRPSSNIFLLVIFIATTAPGTSFAANTDEPRVNPFELPPGIYSKENIPKEQPKTLKLQAIFNINGKRIATISGDNFKEGDYAFGKKVLKIFDSKVIIDVGEKEEVLVLEQRKFKLYKKIQK